MAALLNVNPNYGNIFPRNSYFQLPEKNIVEEYDDSSLPKLTLKNSWEDKNVDKVYTCNFMESQVRINRWIDLNLKFNDSFRQKKYLFPQISSIKIKDDFTKSLENILSFSPETITVGISDDECVYVYFELNNKYVCFDLFFEPEQETEAAVTIFEGKISKLSFTDYLDNSINKLKKEFGINELSNTPFAEA